MKTLILAFIITLTSLSFAGPGHGHSHAHHAPMIKQDKTQEIGQYHVKRLIKAGKLDSSWMKSTFEKSELKTFSGQKEWVVSFKNDKGVKGKVLYIFLKTSGEFVAANFTGK